MPMHLKELKKHTEQNEIIIELLGKLINGNKQETETIKVIDYSEMKRPELMRSMGKTKAPQGWQKWSNEKMLEYLKGE